MATEKLINLIENASFAVETEQPDPSQPESPEEDTEEESSKSFTACDVDSKVGKGKRDKCPEADAIHEYFHGKEKSMLPDPFLQIRIEDDEEDEDSVIVNKRLLLRGFMISETWGDDKPDHEECLLLKDKFDDNFRITVTVGWEVAPKKVKLCLEPFMQKLLEDESSHDLTLVAENGTEFKCQKNIFAAHSKAFSTMLSTTTGMTLARPARMKLNDSTEDGVRYLLQYFYGKELPMDSIPRDVSVELFQTAHKYGFCQLKNNLVEIFLEKGAKWFTSNIVVQLYFYVKSLEGMEKLRDHLLHLMARTNTLKLRSCNAFKKLAPESATDLSFKLVEYWQNHNSVKNNDLIEGRGGGGGVKRKRTK